MQAYGRLFARVYNTYWAAFSNTCATQLLQLFSADAGFSASRRVLLDICCGTGQLARQFLEHGFSVWGIDLSPHMIEWAEANNRTHVQSGAARFLVGDAATFSIPKKVSHITWLYDALNHLPSLAEITSCIRRAYDALEGDGVFVFDMNTRKSLRRWNGVTVQEDDEVFLLNKAVYDETMDRAYTQITGFVRAEDGSYERFSETVYNLALAAAEVTEAVRNAGFTILRCAALPDLAVPVEDPESVQRPFFICRKS
jgi:SAM-dependent methyltransferase